MELVVECYQATAKFPKSEVYGLTNQLQRAAVSVPANIAEGQGRQYNTEFIQFLYMASASLTELETHIQIALRLAYLSSEEANKLLTGTGEVGRHS
jgi:four helix bundle protein